MMRALQLQPDLRGVGMTGQRARDGLVMRLRKQGIRNERVLAAMAMVPRHLFVDDALAGRAYEENALPIGHGQTISQPLVVAKMTEAVVQDMPVIINPENPPKVLEIGTGSGYQAAVLAALGVKVFTVERIGDLLRLARKRFRTLGLDLRSKHDDGRVGWVEHAPFDGILVTAGASALVETLALQLAVGGRLIAPVGMPQQQTLRCVQRLENNQFVQTDLGQVVFVPLLSGVLG